MTHPPLHCTTFLINIFGGLLDNRKLQGAPLNLNRPAHTQIKSYKLVQTFTDVQKKNKINYGNQTLLQLVPHTSHGTQSVSQTPHLYLLSSHGTGLKQSKDNYTQFATRKNTPSCMCTQLGTQVQCQQKPGTLPNQGQSLIGECVFKQMSPLVVLTNPHTQSHTQSHPNITYSHWPTNVLLSSG